MKGTLERFINKDTIHEYACEKMGGGNLVDVIKEIENVFVAQYAMDEVWGDEGVKWVDGYIRWYWLERRVDRNKKFRVGWLVAG